MLSDLSVYVTFGIPLGAVLLYAACAALHSALSHSNIALPKWLNTVLSPVMILPDVHRIHHSIVGRESHSNYGQLFPFWDRLFGVYVNAPREGIRDFRMGVEGEKISSDRPIKAMLKMPWIKGRPGSGEMTET